MSALHTPGPLVCWRKDGSLLIVNVPTRESDLLQQAEIAADFLSDTATDLIDASASLRTHNGPRADVMFRRAQVAAKVARRLRTVIAKATGAAA